MASDPNPTAQAPDPNAVTGYDPYTGPGTPNYTVTSGLGPRSVSVGSSNHRGVDLAAPVGSPVYALADGVVSLREQRDGNGSYTGFGKYLDVSHGYTEDGKEVYSLTAHLSEWAVKDGQQVKKGDVIGYSGNTGTGTGAHIHQEFRVGGVAYDYRDGVANGRDILSGPPSARVIDPLADGVLRRDERGEVVERLQERLVAEGYGAVVGTPDGHFGPKTESAVRQYQQREGLDVDGIAGPETLRSLGVTAEPTPPTPTPAPAPPADPAPAPDPTPSGATALDTPGTFAAVSSGDIVSRSPGEGRLDLATASRADLDATTGALFGDNAAAEFVAAIDDRYGSGQGDFHKYVISLAGHEGGFSFGRENADPAAGFNVGTFQEGGSHIESQAESRDQYEDRVKEGVSVMEREIGRELTAEELQNPAVRDMAALASNREERSTSVIPDLQAYAREHPDSKVAERMAPFADTHFTGDPTQLWTILASHTLPDEQRIESAAYLSQGGVRAIGETLLENRTPGGEGYYLDMDLVAARAAEPDALRAEPAFPTISRGHAGPAVADLQSALVELGYDLGTSGPNGDGADGLFGAATRAAVEAEQAKAGLRDDGVVGPDTWGHIAAAVSREVAVEQDPTAPTPGDGTPAEPTPPVVEGPEREPLGTAAPEEYSVRQFEDTVGIGTWNEGAGQVQMSGDEARWVADTESPGDAQVQLTFGGTADPAGVSLVARPGSDVAAVLDEMAANGQGAQIRTSVQDGSPGTYVLVDESAILNHFESVDAFVEAARADVAIQEGATPVRDQAAVKTPAGVLADHPGPAAYAEVLATITGKLVEPNVNPGGRSPTGELSGAAVIATDALLGLARSGEPLTPEAMQAAVREAVPNPSKPLDESQLSVLKDVLTDVRAQAEKHPEVAEAFAAVRAEQQAPVATMPVPNEPSLDHDRGRPHETPAGAAPTEGDRTTPGGDGQPAQEKAGRTSEPMVIA